MENGNVQNPIRDSKQLTFGGLRELFQPHQLQSAES